MFHSLGTALFTGAAFASIAAAQTVPVNPQLVGTWSTKSHQVFTGPVRTILQRALTILLSCAIRSTIMVVPNVSGLMHQLQGFYDPVNEKMFEPSHTGFSYSFTADGFYEEAYYRAISNPTSPQCPEGLMQWQHGTYAQAPDGSLQLTPFGVDGRQLLSKPCSYGSAVYTRYNQSEHFKGYAVYTDPYHNVLRLDLYRFDGSPLNPMYIAYSPPQMLPTQTLNPTTGLATGGAKATGNSKSKRGLFEEYSEPMNKKVLGRRNEPDNADKWWWIGVGMTAIGGVGYFCF